MASSCSDGSDADGLVFPRRVNTGAPSTSGSRTDDTGCIFSAFEPNVGSKRPHIAVTYRRSARFEAEEIESTIIAKRISKLIIDFQFSSYLALRVPENGDSACSSRNSEIAVYEAALAGGLRLPFPR